MFGQSFGGVKNLAKTSGQKPPTNTMHSSTGAEKYNLQFYPERDKTTYLLFTIRYPKDAEPYFRYAMRTLF